MQRGPKVYLIVIFRSKVSLWRIVLELLHIVHGSKINHSALFAGQFIVNITVKSQQFLQK